MFTYSENLRQKKHHVNSFAIADEIMSIIADYLTFIYSKTDDEIDEIERKLNQLFDTPGFEPTVQHHGNCLFGRFLLKLHEHRRLPVRILSDDPIIWPSFSRLLNHPSTRLSLTVIKRYMDRDVKMPLIEALFYALDTDKFMETVAKVIEWEGFDCSTPLGQVGQDYWHTVASGVLNVCAKNVELACKIVKHPTFSVKTGCKYNTPLEMAIQQRCLPVVRLMLEDPNLQPNIPTQMGGNVFKQAVRAVAECPTGDADSKIAAQILRAIGSHSNCRVNDITPTFYRHHFNPRIARTIAGCEKFDLMKLPLNSGYGGLPAEPAVQEQEVEDDDDDDDDEEDEEM